jgi:activating signal cointegrator complex subunit 1
LKTTPQVETELQNETNSVISISLTSLHSMHTPKSTSILYAGPQDPTNRLYQNCVVLQKLFQEKGYLVPDDRTLKLHATIVNTIYAKSGSRGGGIPRFDAETLLEEWKDFTWAKDFQIEKLAICKMGAKKVMDAKGEIMGEEYEEVASIPFLV